MIKLSKALIPYLFLLFLPTQLGYHFWPTWSFIYGSRIDYLSPTLFFTDILFIVLFIFNVEIFKDFFKKYYLQIFLFIVLVIFNIYISLSWQVSLYKWLKVSEIFITVILFSKLKLTKHLVTRTLFISLIVIFGVGICQIIYSKTTGGLFYLLGERSFSITTPGISKLSVFGVQYLRMYSIFSHPNSLAAYTGLSLFIFMWSVSKETYINKIYKTIYIVITCSILVLSYSLNVLISLFIALVYIFYIRKSKISASKSITTLFIVLSILSILSPILIKGLESNNSSIYERKELTSAAGEVIYKTNLIGVGLGNFIKFLPDSNVNFNVSWKFQPVHNIYLLAISEIGFVYYIIFFGVIYKFFSKANQETNKVFLYAGIVFIMFTGLFDHYWLTLQQNTLELGIVLGLLKNDYVN